MMSLRELLSADGDVFGTWSQVASSDLIEILGASGFDFTIIDCEHSAFGLEKAEELFRACKAAGIAPLIRIPTNDRSWISRSLDAGATGVVVPGISSAAEACDAVAATRFAPAGTRGACPCVRSGDHYVREWAPYATTQENEHGVILLVETRKGLECIEEICGVPGVAALLVGPFDLAVSLGRGDNYGHSEVQNGIERMLAAAYANKVPVMMPVFSPDLTDAKSQVDQWRSRRIRCFVVGTDKILISDQFYRYRKHLEPESTQN